MLPFPLENNYFLSHETLDGVVLLGLLSCRPQKRAGPGHQGPKFIERLVAKQKSRASELLTNEADVGLEFEHSLNTL